MLLSSRTFDYKELKGLDVMENFNELSLQSVQEFIANCDLGQCEAPSITPHGAMSAALTMAVDGGNEGAQHLVEGAGSGAVVEGGLMVFTPGTSAEVRKEVLDCLLLATLVANNAHDIETENKDWFGTFNDVLLNLGWPVHDMNYRDYQSGGAGLSMDKLILEMLASAIATAALPGAAGAKLLEVATQLIQGFSSQPGPLKLFEQKSKSQQGANFRVGTCHEAQDGEVYITLATVNFRIKRNMTSVLGFHWSDGEAQIYGANRGLVFNRRHYERVKDDVEDKLGKGARANIAAFEI
ncbi:hypothetical protein NRB16_19930 [Pseudomonas sp. LJDD11]|uniref:hypothetical protein n=1 Tax=Pseudomonas sp. LJDD11 TaxID=2931984 RepID=UPI00211BB80C|nr:hypothetical protein [Pseudomonas sp. LJDD11]MCQ9425787.1 hypothetical protein [Pseudomonas sp. LJDD11]